MLPVAPGRHRAAAELAERATRTSRRPARAPRARWRGPGRGCCGSGRSARRRRAARGAAAKNSPTWRGFAIPVVSPKATSSQPASASRSAISKTRSGGDLALVRTAERRPRSRPRSAAPRPRAVATVALAGPSSDSAIERLTFSLVVGLRRGEEDVDLVEAVALRERALEAALVRDQHRVGDPVAGASIASSTSSASASCGITSGRTNEVTSSRCSPLAASIRSAGPSRRSGSPRARSGSRRAGRPRESGRARQLAHGL